MSFDIMLTVLKHNVIVTHIDYLTNYKSVSKSSYKPNQEFA